MLTNVIELKDVQTLCDLYQSNHDETYPCDVAVLTDTVDMEIVNAILLQRATMRLFPDLKVIPVAVNPYNSVPEMAADVYERNIMYMGADYYEQTSWSASSNYAFRIVHDLMHVWKAIPDDAAIEPYAGCEFSLDGELCAYAAHIELMHSEGLYTRERARYIWAELIAKIAVLRVTGTFPAHKLVRAPEFDPIIERVLTAYGLEW